MKQQWRIPDFLDLEYFFASDRKLADSQGENVVRDRDRELYLHTIGGEDAGSSPNSEWLIYRWLQERRSQENQEQSGQALLPGRMWYELYGLFWSIFSFLAFGMGGGLCYSFLSYSGEQPVNVSLFLLVFVGLQLFLLLLLPLGWGIRKLRGVDLRGSLLLTIVNNGLNRFLFTIRKRTYDTLGQDRKETFKLSLAAVQRSGSGYGSLFFWPLFLLFQLFGIAFNFGVLGALLVKVSSVDLAFGWQSTIQLSTDFVARMVELLALPWSWFVDNAYPTAEQVAGSRMILKDGFFHLASADLVSWWPFLCLAICCYCLLPRLFLFMLGTVARKRSLDAVRFTRAEHNQLLHRLLTPRLRTEQVHGEVEETDRRSTAPGRTKEPAMKEEQEVLEGGSPAVHGKIVALIPDDLYAECDLKHLATYCSKQFGYTLEQALLLEEQLEKNEQLLTPLLLLQEAWQPPILELIDILKQLRKQSRQDTHIIVALVGKPLPETLFTAVTRQDLQVWQQKVSLLADPYLQVSPLVELS